MAELFPDLSELDTRLTPPDKGESSALWFAVISDSFQNR